MSEKEITISQSEFDLVLQVERIKTRQEMNEGKFNKHIESTEPLLHKIFEAIQRQPHDLTLCKNELWKEAEDEFMTKEEARQMEMRIEAKMDTIRNKLAWFLSVVIFIITLGSQLAIKLIMGM